MAQRSGLAHEISPAWRGAPWDRRREYDWDIHEPAAPPTARPLRALGLAVIVGVALGVTVAQGLARQDRARLDALMSGVQAAG